MDDVAARLRLIRTPGVGPVTYRQLIARFGTAEAALAALPDLARRGGGRAPPPPDPALVARERETVARMGARHVLLGDDDYPPLLGELDDAPPVLTVRGDLSLAARPTVALVGARNASAAACRFARTLAHDLAGRGAASTTTVPSDRPAMMRLRCGKWRARGSVPGGISATSSPSLAIRSCNAALSGG